MIGLIDCRTQDPGKSWAGFPLEMLEFFDRPLLQHAVEQMVQVGVTHCVLIAEDTSAVMKRWGEGERWGCTFSAIRPHTIIRFLAGLGADPLMIGRGDTVPCISVTPLVAGTSHATELIFTEAVDNGLRSRIFTGWAIASPQALLEHCFATHGAEGLLQSREARASQVTMCIRADSAQLLLQSQLAVLNAIDAAVIFHGMEERPGVWTARNVRLHPSVKVTGRVYLGENVRVQPDATLVGPVVICRDAIVDSGAVVTDSLVQPATYIGRGVGLQRAVAMPGVIVSAGSSSPCTVDDPQLLGSTGMSLWAYTKGLLRLDQTQQHHGR